VLLIGPVEAALGAALQRFEAETRQSIDGGSKNVARK
jgi:hypothetical protein